MDKPRKLISQAGLVWHAHEDGLLCVVHVLSVMFVPYNGQSCHGATAASSLHLCTQAGCVIGKYLYAAKTVWHMPVATVVVHILVIMLGVYYCTPITTHAGLGNAGRSSYRQQQWV